MSFFSILQDDFCRNTFLSSIENTNLSQQNSGNSSVFIKNTATFSDENTWCATSELEEEEIEEEHTQDEIAANYCAVAFTRTVGNAFDATQQADYGALQNIFWRKIPFYVLCCQRKIFF